MALPYNRKTMRIYGRLFFVLGVAVAVFSIDITGVSAAVETAGSSNWAGYVAENGNYDGVGASWVITEADNSVPTRAHATWIGIGGYGTNDLIQAGTIAVVENNDTVEYRAWIETLPDPAIMIPIKVSVGDEVLVSIVEKADDEWTIRFVNKTTKKFFTKTVAYKSLHKSADWVQELVSLEKGLRIPIDNFESVAFTDIWAMQNGKKRTLRQIDAHRVYMNDSSGRPLVRVSAIDTTGNSFTVTRSNTKVTLGSVNKNYAKVAKENGRIKSLTVRQFNPIKEIPLTMRVKWE